MKKPLLIINLEINDMEIETISVKNFKSFKSSMELFFDRYQISDPIIKRKIISRIQLSLPKYVKKRFPLKLKNPFNKRISKIKTKLESKFSKIKPSLAQKNENSKRSKHKKIKSFINNIKINRSVFNSLKVKRKKVLSIENRKNMLSLSKIKKKNQENILIWKKKFSSSSTLFKKKISLPQKKIKVINSSNFGKKLSLGNLRDNFNMNQSYKIQNQPILYQCHTERSQISKNEKIDCIYTFLEKIFFNLDSQKLGRIGSKNLDLSRLNSSELKSIEEILIEFYTNPNKLYTYEEFYRLNLQVKSK